MNNFVFYYYSFSGIQQDASSSWKTFWIESREKLRKTIMCVSINI